MKRIVSVFAVLMMVAGSAIAMPSMYGSYGLVRTIAPDNAGAMNFGIGFRSFLSMKEVDSTNSWMNIDVYPEGYFAFSDMFELSLAPVYNYLRTDPWVGGAGNYNGLFDTRLGVKYSHKMSDAFCLGVYAGYDIPTMGMMDSLLETKDPAKHTGAIHGMLIPGFIFGAAKLDLNVGIAYDLDKKADGSTVDTTDNKSVYPNMSVPFGIGFSYKASDMFMPFLEVTGQYDMDSVKYGPAATEKTRGLLNYNFFVTPGVRVSFPFGLNFDAAFSYNLIDTADGVASKGDPFNPDNPDWQIIAGLSYAPAKATGPKVPPTGIISGKVVDKAGKGLAAMVVAGGITANTDPATGDYTLSGVLIDKAPVEIKAEAKGYIAKQASIMLTKKNKKTPAMQDFTLELKPIPVGTAKGLIKDALTGAIIEGSVAFAGPKAETAKTAAGAYTAKLQIGNYNAATNVAGYINKKAAISIAENGTAMNDFVLYQNGAALSVNAVWTAATRYTIKSINVANIVAALNENPNAKITVKAYVDAVSGTVTKQKLATKRADAIKAAIVKAGIPADKIVTEGIVVAPRGKTSAMRNANTKVEAVISE